jgi:hypothetical protein
MKPRTVLALLVLLALLPLGGGCGPKKPSTPLGQALAMLPADAYLVSFTDWTLIKTYAGFPNLNSQGSREDRQSFWSAISRGQVPALQVGSDPNTMAEVWGWDDTDLVWTAAAFTEDSNLGFVLRFRDDFDFAPLLALFAERDFEQGEYQGVTVYSHKPTFRADWLRPVDPAILNTALLPAEKMLVLAAEIDNLHALLDVYKGKASSVAGNQAALAVADRLGGVATAELLPMAGGRQCPTLSVGGILEGSAIMPPEYSRRLQAALANVHLHAYSSFGVGYRYEEGRLIGLFAAL